MALLVPLLLVGMLFGVTKAVRTSLVRLRDIDAKQPGRWRALLAVLPIGVAFAGCTRGSAHLVPGRGAAHVLGVVAAHAVALVAVQSLLAPLWLVALRARRLKPDLQARLDALARRLGVRLGGFRCYPGRSQKVANAVQFGLLPRLRYVLVSDYLLDHLHPNEVDAVVAHDSDTPAATTSPSSSQASQGSGPSSPACSLRLPTAGTAPGSVAAVRQAMRSEVNRRGASLHRLRVTTRLPAGRQVGRQVGGRRSSCLPRNSDT